MKPEDFSRFPATLFRDFRDDRTSERGRAADNKSNENTESEKLTL